MLKITTVHESARDVLLVLDGNITQQWGALLDEVCRDYLRQNKTIQLDSAAVRFIDAPGIEVLRNFPSDQVTLVNTPAFVMQLLKFGGPS
jgi:ABC-type transporter Mla MlaB component